MSLFYLFPELVREMYSPIGIINSMTDFNDNETLLLTSDKADTSLKVANMYVEGTCQLRNIFGESLNVSNKHLGILPAYHKDENNKSTYVELYPIIYNDFNELSFLVENKKSFYNCISPSNFINKKKAYIPSINQMWKIGMTRLIGLPKFYTTTKQEYEIGRCVYDKLHNNVTPIETSILMTTKFPVVDFYLNIK